MNAAGCIHTPVWQAKPYSTKGRDPNWEEAAEEEEEAVVVDVEGVEL